MKIFGWHAISQWRVAAGGRILVHEVWYNFFVSGDLLRNTGVPVILG